MDETDDNAEESASTPGETGWRPAVWGPLALLAAHGLFGFLFNPIAGDGPDSEEVGGLLIGVLLSQPMVCAWWAAWTQASWVLRAPTGTAACIFLLLMSSLREWDAMIAVLFAVIAFTFWGLFAVLRWKTGWRLVRISTAGLQTPATSVAQFGLRFLIGWTTIVAALCALAKAVAFTTDHLSRGVEAVTLPIVFTLLVLPTPVLVHLILADRFNTRPLAVFALVVGACVLGATFIATSLGPMPAWGELLWIFSWFNSGAIIGGAVSAVALRWSGYRMICTGP
ncbi:hypothetical protein Pla123a_04040 [Posidoniimonas polymericola]|uniref:Uncharacterized protein n=1 Tax=Posidoniimonas polymericola TaxID=2528002 RepID=A0A5C5ZEX7_9BACT|nr:hypothetical protein [Posidoniimonas polymericola]TWT85597.1 hypothetical protein Pla123a_04040 [Posidoniimonas polymericola]